MRIESYTDKGSKPRYAPFSADERVQIETQLYLVTERAVRMSADGELTSVGEKE